MRAWLSGQPWLGAKVEEMALSYAIARIIPAHVAEVRERKTRLIAKTEQAVKERLLAEIQHWDSRSAELKQKEAAGKMNARLNSHMADRLAEELAASLQKRLAELETEKLISAVPPVVVGGALVIPRGLLNKLTGQTDQFTVNAMARREIELTALKAVLNIETALGHIPRDVSAAKCGYDVESLDPEAKRAAAPPLRFIEVKGRVKGADTVTVTKNEILTAFNKPDEYILALVEVDGENTQTVYLKKPFGQRPDFAATSVNYNIAELMNNSEVIYEKYI